jgi:hypothetical protein
MDEPPGEPSRPLPADVSVVHARAPTVGFYRYLYNTVGEEYLWWLRRVAGDAEIASLLADPRISVHVLYRDGAPAGFYEFDRRHAPASAHPSCATRSTRPGPRACAASL